MLKKIKFILSFALVLALCASFIPAYADTAFPVSSLQEPEMPAGNMVVVNWE